MPSSTRRHFLAAIGASGLVATAGCVSHDRASHDGRWPTEPSSFVTDRDGPGWDTYVAWSRETRGAFPPSMPIVADGVVYHLDSREAGRDTDGGTWLSALDAATGEVRWETRLWATGEFYYLYHQGPPVLDGDTLFAQTHDGVKAVSTEGELLWTFENIGPSQPLPDAAPPVVTSELVVAGSYGSRIDEPERLYGIDRETGAEVWRRTLGRDGYPWRLERDGDTCYVPILPDGRVLAVNATTGETERTYAVEPRGSVTATAGSLYVPSRTESDAGRLVAFDADSGTERWRVSIRRGASAESKPVCDDGRLYYNEFGTLVARDPDTGAERWRLGAGGDPQIYRTTPAVAGDALYVSGYRTLGGDRGEGSCVFAVDPSTGRERGRIAPWSDTGPSLSVPAVVEGAVYLSHPYDGLVCLEDCAAGVLDRCLIG